MDSAFPKWLRKLPRRYKKYRQPQGLWSMTIPRELAFCESYARECFSGQGRIGGPWMLVRCHHLFARARTEAKLAGQNQSHHRSFRSFYLELVDGSDCRPHQDAENVRRWGKLLPRCGEVARALQECCSLISTGPARARARSETGGTAFRRCHEVVATGKKNCHRIFPGLDPGRLGRRTSRIRLSQSDRCDESSPDVAYAPSFRMAASNPGFGQRGFSVQKKNRSRYFAVAGTGIVFTRRNR